MASFGIVEHVHILDVGLTDFLVSIRTCFFVRRPYKALFCQFIILALINSLSLQCLGLVRVGAQQGRWNLFGVNSLPFYILLARRIDFDIGDLLLVNVIGKMHLLLPSFVRLHVVLRLRCQEKTRTRPRLLFGSILDGSEVLFHLFL